MDCIQKNTIFLKKSIAKAKPVVYTNPCCDIDSVEA